MQGDCTLTLATSPQPGAVAILQLHGKGAGDVLGKLTGKADWQAGRYLLVSLGGVDEGLAVRLGDNWVQLMPHGGPRVVQKLIDRLVELGATFAEKTDARAIYPEADSAIEADALHLISQAASPAAIDLLLAQPGLWRQATRAGAVDAQAVLARSAVLDQLVHPPAVVVVGPANVGKSTLTNRMLGRAVSIVADLPGTTRDWVAGLAELGFTFRDQGAGPANKAAAALAVRWMDTPGLRASEDAIEQEAIALARQVIAQAAVLIVMRDGEHDWPAVEALPREPDVWVVNKADIGRQRDGDDAGDGRVADQPLAISAVTGQGVDRLQAAVVRSLGFADMDANALWAFSPALRDALSQNNHAALADYLRGSANA